MSSRFQSAVLVIAVLAALLLALLPVADDVGSEHVDASFKRALVGYALARGLNGVISVAQGTEVAVQPAGVGVNFTPGEILDPVNDLVERFSWIMMLATSSLGIQKVLLSMSAWQGLLFGLVAVAVLLIGSQFLLESPRVRSVLARLFLFLLVLRFMMPAIAIGNDWVYRTFLQQDYQMATESLQNAQLAIGEINEEVRKNRKKEPDSFLDRARNAYQQMVDSIDIDRRLDEYRKAAESISENTIQLVVVFLMQTLVFPLLFLFVIYSLIKRLTH